MKKHLWNAFASYIKKHFDNIFSFIYINRYKILDEIPKQMEHENFLFLFFFFGIKKINRFLLDWPIYH